MIPARQGLLALAVCVLASAVGPAVGQVPQGETSDLCSCHGVPKKWVILAGDETKRIQLTAYAALTGAQGTKTVALLPAPKVADLGTYPLGELTSIEFAVVGLDPDVHECQITQPDVYANLYSLPQHPLRVAIRSPDNVLEYLTLTKIPGGNLWTGTWPVPADKVGQYRFRLRGIVGDLHADHPQSDDPDVDANYRAKLTIAPKVDIEEIHFDHNTSGMTDDGVTIKKDKDTDITAPEWKRIDSKNDPACYIKSKTPKVKVKLKVQPSSITSARVRAVAKKGRLPNLNQKTVTFIGGVSGLEEFTMATAIPGKVTNILDSWQWKVSDINASGSAEYDAGETGEHEVYVILDTPKDPMAKPWTNVLELACHDNWAGGQINAAPAVEAIGKAIYQSLAPLPHQINYDGGRPWYSYKETQAPDELGDGWYFHLTEFFGDIAAANVNFSCSCVANFYEIVIAAIGVDGQWKALDVDPTAGNLVDYISGGTGISCHWYDPIGTPGWTESDWVFHQVLLYNGNIYDACIKSDSNNDPVNHNPVWMLGLGEAAYEGLLGSYDNNATKTGHTQLK